MQDKEEFYFKMNRECLKEQTEILKEHQKTMAKRITKAMLLAIVTVELFEVIKSLLIYSNAIYRVVRFKN